MHLSASYFLSWVWFRSSILPFFCRGIGLRIWESWTMAVIGLIRHQCSEYAPHRNVLNDVLVWIEDRERPRKENRLHSWPVNYLTLVASCGSRLGPGRGASVGPAWARPTHAVPRLHQERQPRLDLWGDVLVLNPPGIELEGHPYRSHIAST